MANDWVCHAAPARMLCTRYGGSGPVDKGETPGSEECVRSGDRTSSTDCLRFGLKAGTGPLFRPDSSGTRQPFGATIHFTQRRRRAYILIAGHSRQSKLHYGHSPLLPALIRSSRLLSQLGPVRSVTGRMQHPIVVATNTVGPLHGSASTGILLPFPWSLC